MVAPKKIHMTMAVALSVAMPASRIVTQVELAMRGADDEGAEGADAGGLDRRRDAEEDHAEHEDDQQHRHDRAAQQPELLRRS